MKHNASVIGLDIAKNIFYAVGAHGHEVLKRKLTRNQVLAFFANLPAAKVGMEACASAHYWARQINALGHDVKLIAGQHVSRRVVGNKNDYRDAKVICELRSQPQTLYVPINTEAQQDVQMLHRVSSTPGGKPHGAVVADPGVPRGVRPELSPMPNGLANGTGGRVGR